MYLVWLRMMYSMSDQFAELKSILCASSSSSVTSGFIVRDGFGDSTSTSSDITSTDSDSDFNFPPPTCSTTTTETVSPLTPDAFQMIVQDLSAPEKPGQSRVFFFYPYHPTTNPSLPIRKKSRKNCIIYLSFFSRWLLCAGSENWECDREGAFDDFF